MRKTRCKPGDIALIVHDTPECARNIGRVVYVDGPLKFNREYGKYCWLIEPVNATPYYVDWSTRGLGSQVVSFRDYVEHPDRWMLPIGRGSSHFVRHVDGFASAHRTKSLEQMEITLRQLEVRMDRARYKGLHPRILWVA